MNFPVDDMNTLCVEGVRPVHFGDVEVLREFVTETWGDWGKERPVTMEDIRLFGNLTDNHQWIHESADRCRRESPYGGIIAHGFFILTLLPSLLPTERFVLTGYRQRIVRGGETFRFPSPVFPGDTIHMRTRLTSVESARSGRGSILTRDAEVWSLTGTQPVVTCSLMLQYF